MRSTPITLAAARRSARDGVWDLRTVCPHCGRLHTHGGGDGLAPVGGHRKALCDSSCAYTLVVSQSRWHATLIHDVALLTALLGERATSACKSRARSGLAGLVDDAREMPGYARLVDSTGAPAFGLSELDVLVPASGPVAAAIRAAGVENSGRLYSDDRPPWVSPARAAEYVSRLRTVLDAAAVAEASK